MNHKNSFFETTNKKVFSEFNFEERNQTAKSNLNKLFKISSSFKYLKKTPIHCVEIIDSLRGKRFK